MKNRILTILLAAFLIVGVFGGCGAKSADTNGIEQMPPDTAVGDEAQETLSPEQLFLTNNRPISGGPKSELLTAEGIGFIPTGRLSGPDQYVRTTKSMVPSELEAGGTVLTYVYSYNESGQQISSSSQGSGAVYETFEYDEHGRLLQHVNDDDLYFCHYDADGRLQSIEHYDKEYYPDGWRGRFIYSYEGNTVTESYYRGDNETLEYYTVYADDKMQEYRYLGKYSQKWYFYEYNEYGNLKYMLSAEEGEKEILFEYHYNEHGVLTQVCPYEAGEPTGFDYLYFYNESGDCVRIEIGWVDQDTDEWVISIYLEFTYDADGNLLTERSFEKDGESLTGYYIEYTYELRS